MSSNRNRNIKPMVAPATAPPVLQGKPKTWPQQTLLALLLGAISFIAYLNTCANGFVLDDKLAIEQNSIVRKGLAAIPQLLATPYHHGWSLFYHDNLYRPLPLIFFSIWYQFFELNPVPYHLFNILIFSGCVIFFFLFLNKLFDRQKTAIAFIAALLFALHPIHTEVVANIKSADELLCFFFAFLGLNIFFSYQHSGKALPLVGGAFCFLLSLLSKETSITFLLLIPFIFFFYQAGNRKRSIHISVSVALAAVVFLSCRYAVLDHYNSGQYTHLDIMENILAKNDLSFESRIATALLVLGHYLRLLVVPYPLICDYSFSSIPYAHLSDPLVLCTLLAYLFLAIFSVIRLLRNKRDPYAFGILFFLVTIALFSNLVFLIGATMAERFLFFGSAGFCLVVALLIARLSGSASGISVLRNPWVLVVLIPLCLIYAIVAFSRNKDWHDEYTLYTTDLAKAPADARLHYYLSDYLLNHLFIENDIPKQTETVNYAISLLNEATAIYPGYVNAQYDLATIYYDLKIFDSAEVHYIQAYQADTQSFLGITGLAHLYFVTRNYPQSISLNKKILTLYPSDAQTWLNTGACYLNSGYSDSSLSYFYNAMSLDPSLKSVNLMLMRAYTVIGNKDSFQKYQAITQANDRSAN